MITKPNRLGGLLLFFQCAKNTVRYHRGRRVRCNLENRDSYEVSTGIKKPSLQLVMPQEGLKNDPDIIRGVKNYSLARSMASAACFPRSVSDMKKKGSSTLAVEFTPPRVG